MAEQFQTGWLGPTGELVPCEAYEHLSVAEIICERAGYNVMVPIPLDELLLNHGWVHITTLWTRTSGTSYFVDWRRPLTPEQKQALIPLFGEGHCPIMPGSRAHWEHEFD